MRRLLILLLVAACGRGALPEDVDAGVSAGDAGAGADAGGTVDAGGPDASVPLPDAGEVDAGVVADAGAPDAGGRDGGGSVDAGQVPWDGGLLPPPPLPMYAGTCPTPVQVKKPTPPLPPKKK